jgi:hypothetical protein
MDLEERSIEHLPDRCESCGATLTNAEKQAALERGGTPVLCANSGAEQVPIAEDETGDPDAAF